MTDYDTKGICKTGRKPAYSPQAKGDCQEPNQSSRCVEAAAYYQANKERIKAQVAAYKQKHKIEILAKARAYAAKHRNRIGIYKAAYAIANADKIKRAKREYYARNRTKIIERTSLFYATHKAQAKANTRKWVLANPEKRRASSARWCRAHKKEMRLAAALRRARIKTSSTDKEIRECQSKIKRLLSVKRADCAYCSKPFLTAKMHIEHIIPIARGGKHAADNVCLACEKCNRNKNCKRLGSEWIPPQLSLFTNYNL